MHKVWLSIAGILVYFAARLVYDAVCFRRGAARLPEQTSRVLSSGYSLELPSRERVLSSENALPSYEKLSSSNPSLNHTTSAHLAYSSKFEVPSSSRYSSVASVLGEVEALTRMPICLEDPQEWTSGKVKRPWLAFIKNCAKLLGGRSLAYAKEGNWYEAIQDLRYIIRLSDQVGQTELMLTTLVHYSLLIIALGVVEDLAQLADSSQQLSGISDAVQGGAVRPMRLALAGEFAYSSVQMRFMEFKYKKSDMENVKNLPKLRKQMQLHNLRLDSVFTPLEVYRSASLASGYELFLGVLGAAEGTKGAETGRRIREIESAKIRSSNPLDRLGFQFSHHHYSDSFVAEIMVKTRLSAVLSALQVLRYRYTTGGLPTSLNELGVDAIDYFSSKGNQLAYRPYDQAFEIYSVGEMEREAGSGSRRWGHVPNPGMYVKVQPISGA